MIQTAGTWDADAGRIFFAPELRAFFDKMVYAKDVLFAVGDIRSNDVDAFRKVCKGRRVLLDSGVFGLAMRTAKNLGLSHDAALSLPPEQIEGYDALMSTYREVVSDMEPDIWGYIEVDYGGRERKKIVRAELEADGFRPIPVFHAMLDGWDYFRELDEQYDRICLGSMVKSTPAQRLEILHRVAEERRNVKWIHSLGVTPTAVWQSCPTESCDSTAWSKSRMYGGPMSGLASWRTVHDESLGYETERYHELKRVQEAEAFYWSQQITDRQDRERP